MLVGSRAFVRRARRARKRLGGGTRQVGVVAAMGAHALDNNVNRLADDHARAGRMARALHGSGFRQPQGGRVQTNLVYFGLPPECAVSKAEFAAALRDEHGVLVGAGYSKGGELFRACTHLDVDDEDVDRAIEAIISVALRK